MASRKYTGTGIVVHWDSDRCIHSERCTSGAPTVFDRSARPWVNIEAATADEIARVIDTCPSGALSYTRTDGVPNGRGGRDAGDVASAVTSVVLTPELDGPLHVHGRVDVTRPDGTIEVVDNPLLCRCGQSQSKPFCDNSHARLGFRAPGVDLR
jgi:uncharacterized Fe-S cluster protein YjdI